MGARALFWDDEHARAVARRLARDGFAAEIAREAFAGEDDDEDHPWAVTTDAPDAMLELLADEFDGWVDHYAARAREAHTGASSVPLPTAPRRHHRDPRAATEESPGGS